MSKISQFKIRKPKNSKTSQNVLLKNPQKSITKKITRLHNEMELKKPTQN